MSSGNMDNKGKAVVREEDVPPMAAGSGEPVRSPVEAVPLAIAAPVLHPGSESQKLDDSLILVIKRFMLRCIGAMETGNTSSSNNALVALSALSSADGDPIQRVASAFTEALGRRALEPLHGLSWALQDQLRQPPPLASTTVARQWFHKLSPLLRAAALAANHAIVKAMEAEKDVHVIDLGGASPRQWLDLIRLFAVRPGGAPSLRLTIIGDNEIFLSSAAKVLTEEAERLHVPFVFNHVHSHIDRVPPAVIVAHGIESDQGSLVISSTLQLHRLLADVKTIVYHPTVPHLVITSADRLLRVLHDLSPKLFVLTEQEADHSGGNLWDRVSSAFDYYTVLFNDLEVSGVPRGSPNRTAVERMVLGEEIADIVTRKGAARRERHEKMARWVPRLLAAGFHPAQVDMEEFMGTIRQVGRLSDGDKWKPLYQVLKEKGCLFIHSSMTPMFSVSLWQPATKSE